MGNSKINDKNNNNKKKNNVPSIPSTAVPLPSDNSMDIDQISTAIGPPSPHQVCSTTATPPPHPITNTKCPVCTYVHTGSHLQCEMCGFTPTLTQTTETTHTRNTSPTQNHTHTLNTTPIRQAVSPPSPTNYHTPQTPSTTNTSQSSPNSPLPCKLVRKRSPSPPPQTFTHITPLPQRVC